MLSIDDVLDTVISATADVLVSVALAAERQLQLSVGEVNSREDFQLRRVWQPRAVLSRND